MVSKRQLWSRWPAFAILLVVVIGLGLASYASYRVTASQFRRAAENDLAAVARLKVDQIARWRTERIQDLEVLRENPWVARAAAVLLRGGATPAAEREFMAWLEVVRRQSGLVGVGVYDWTGHERYHAGVEMASPKAGADLPRLLGAGKVVITDLHRLADTGNIHLDLLVPLHLHAPEGSEPIGALVLRIDPRQFLYPLIQTWPGSSPTAETLLVRKDGDSVLYLNDLKFRKSAALALRVPLSRVTTPAVQAALGRTGIVEGRDYRDVPVLAVLRPIPDSPWYIVAKIDAEEVAAPIRQRALLLISQIATLVLAAGFAALYLFVRQQSAFERHNRQSATQRRTLEGRLDALTRYANDIILLIDRSGSLVDVNDRAVEALGYSREELLRMSVRDLRDPGHPDDADTFPRDARPLDSRRFETVYRRKDGSSFPVDVSARFIEVEDTVLHQAIVRDITERKAAETQLARINRLYALLSEVNQAILRLRDAGRLLDELCRIAVELGGFRAAWVGMADETGTFIRPTAAGGVTLEELRHFPVLLEDGPEGRGPCSVAVRERRLVVSLDLDADSRPGRQWREEARRRGLLAGAAVPLVVGSRVIGAFSLYSSDPALFDAPELRLLEELGADISFALTALEQDAERRRIERLHLEREEHYRLLFESSPFPMWVYDVETLRFLAVNDQAVQQYGYSREEFLRMTLSDIRPADEIPRLMDLIAAVRQGGGSQKDLVRHRRKSGALRDVEVAGHGVRFEGRAARMVAVNDVTDKLRLEQQLRQSQKMEAIGRLAGGIAHDFNNLLTAITGYADLTLTALPPGDALRPNVTEIRHAADRAADLTGQLLAFSRKQILQPRVLDVNQVISDIENMLRRIIGEDVDLALALAPTVGAVRADRSQIEQVLLNLAVNGRDAMPGGGRLTIATSDVDLDEAAVRELGDVAPGGYVRLTVTDTGAGIPPEVQAHLFEPFFTTKERDKGTGLGLSTVYGIVTQSGGAIRAASAVGNGATFTIDLPRASGAADRPSPPDADAAPPGGSETILIAEDDSAVRSLTRRVLERLGYRVIEGADGRQALEAADALAGPIDLLLTDVIMPVMGGRDLARELSAKRPGLKTLFMTGYTEDAIVQQGVLEPGLHLIKKPFAPDALARKVREVIRGC